MVNLDSIGNLFRHPAPDSPRNFISDIHDQLNTLISPLFIIMASRFFKQLPLEDYGNNAINRIKRKDELKPAKKPLASSALDFAVKGFAFAFLVLYLNDYFLNLKFDNSDLKTKTLFGIKTLTLISYLFMAVSALVTPYLPWFMIARILSAIMVLEHESSLFFFAANIFLSLINVIGLKQKPWRSYFSYYTFDVFSRFISFATIVRMVVYYFF